MLLSRPLTPCWLCSGGGTQARDAAPRPCSEKASGHEGRGGLPRPGKCWSGRAGGRGLRSAQGSRLFSKGGGDASSGKRCSTCGPQNRQRAAGKRGWDGCRVGLEGSLCPRCGCSSRATRRDHVRKPEPRGPLTTQQTAGP